MVNVWRIVKMALIGKDAHKFKPTNKETLQCMVTLIAIYCVVAIVVAGIMIGC